MDTLADVRREISKVYRESRSNLIPVEAASKFAHILTCVGRAIETSDLEQRVAAIEAKG